jgi:hypothetical protein
MTMFLYFLRLATVTVGIVISLQQSTTTTIRNVANAFDHNSILAAHLGYIQVKHSHSLPCMRAVTVLASSVVASDSEHSHCRDY